MTKNYSLQTRLNLDLTQHLTLHPAFLQLRLKHHLHSNHKFCFLFTSHINTTKFSASKGTSHLKVMWRPLITDKCKKNSKKLRETSQDKLTALRTPDDLSFLQISPRLAPYTCPEHLYTTRAGPRYRRNSYFVIILLVFVGFHNKNTEKRPQSRKV